MNIPDTSSLYLRFFETDDNGDEIENTSVFETVHNACYCGAPIDEGGEALCHDKHLYAKIEDGVLVQVKSIGLIKNGDGVAYVFGEPQQSPKNPLTTAESVV